MDDERFFAIATEVVNGLESELRRARPEERGKWRALEVGCGSGRLMRAMSRHFGELHGAEASGDAVQQARGYLHDVPNTRVERADSDHLAPFEAHTYDFVYALDPSFAAVREMRRVLQAGGYLWMRFGSTAHSRLDLLEFAQSEDFQVLALEPVGGQGIWTAWRKQPRGWFAALQGPQNIAEGGPLSSPVVIRRIHNASSSEPLAPCRGRFASIAIRTENLPLDAGLHHLKVTVGSSFGTVTYIGPMDRFGWQEVRTDLPDLEATGLLPVQLYWLDAPISAPLPLRVIPPGPAVPRLVSLSKRVTAHGLKLTMEEVAYPEELEVRVGGLPADEIEYVCTDRRSGRYDISIQMPQGIAPGPHSLEVRLGRRKVPLAQVEVAV